MKLSLMLEADRINVQALNMGRIVVDVVNAKIIGRFSPFLMSAIGH